MSDLPPGSGDPLTNRPALNTASGPRRYRFPGTMRILRSREFERALRDGVRVNDQRLTLWSLPNGLSHARLGLIVGRKHGNAVRRNRIKRILRSAFRLSQHELPQGLDLVCAPRVGAELELEGCRNSLARLAAQVSRRLVKRRPRGEDPEP